MAKERLSIVEVVVNDLVMLDGRQEGQQSGQQGAQGAPQQQAPASRDDDSSLPF